MKSFLTALLASTGVLTALCWSMPSAAQPFPNRPIKLMVPFTPGGGTDILARIVAQKMGDALGQQIVVDNRPGGNTLVATELLVRAPADGYTLLMQTNNFAANPTLYAGKLAFDSRKDVVPVSLVAGNPHVLVVHPSVLAKTLPEYIALAKAKPGTLTFASGETTQTIQVLIAPDAITTSNKNFKLNLGKAVNALFADSQAIATILNNG